MEAHGNATHTFHLKLILRQRNQKYLLDMLLRSSSLSEQGVAEILDIKPQQLQALFQGKMFLDKNRAERLMTCFCMLLES